MTLVSIPSAFAQQEPERTRVIIDSTDPDVVLQHFEEVPVANGEWKRKWVPVCSAPCGARFETTGLYRVGGEGIPVSHAFELPPVPSGVTLQVDAGSGSERAGGVVLTVAGGSLMVAGAMMPFIWPRSSPDDPNPALDDDDQRRSMLIAAGSAALAGLVAIAAGIYLIVDSKTHVVTMRSAAATPLRFSRASTASQCH